MSNKKNRYQQLISPKKLTKLSPKLSTCFAFIATILLSPASQANYNYACKIPKSYYKHVSCTSNSRYFLAVKDSGSPVSIIGKDGKRVIDLMHYTKVDASKLKNGVLPVQRSGKVGYVNMSGHEVVPIIYNTIRGDKLTSGWARAANDNRIIVKKNGKFGIISTSNQTILPFDSKYETISDYKSGVARIFKGNETIRVDKNARRITPSKTKNPKSSSLVNEKPVSDTRLPVPSKSSMTNEIWQPKEQDGKWGFVNNAGVPMITFSFDAVMPFSEGLAAVRINENWGFVDLAGSLVIPFRFDDSGIIRGNNDTYLGVPPLTFKDGKAWIGNLNNGNKLCINKEGVNVPCDGVSVVITQPITPFVNEVDTILPPKIAHETIKAVEKTMALPVAVHPPKPIKIPSIPLK